MNGSLGCIFHHFIGWNQFKLRVELVMGIENCSIVEK